VDPQAYQNLQFGGGVSQTIVSPIALLIVLVAGVMICVVPLRRAIAPFLIAAVLIPNDQVILLGPLHFPMLRILIIFGVIRMFRARSTSKIEILSGGLNAIDKALILLTFFAMLNGILLWRLWGEVIFQLGELYSAFGTYFLLRFLIRDEADVKQVLRVFACITGVVALVMVCEQVTGRNLLYAALGGSRASVFESVISRDDHLRATGCFGHPILAGTFGGILLPLFVGLWYKDKKERKYAAVGVVAATVMAFAAASSTALAGFLGGIVALCFWPLRRRMRVVRWTIAIILVSLHLVMKAPVWHLVSRIDLTGSSSGYHRYQLINQCILHFWDWVLIGTKDFGNWGWDMWDLSNQYVAAADTTGLIPLLSLLAIIVFGFKYVGRTRRAVSGDRSQELFIWGLGASLFANVVAFFGISYFDQTIVAWYALLAMIIAMAVSVRKAQKNKTERGSKEKVPAASFDSELESIEVQPPTWVAPLVDNGIKGLRFSPESLR
jgi:hypothetical protein